MPTNRVALLETFTSEDPSLREVDAGDELPYVPRHQASATVALEHARGGLAVGTTYVSPMRESAGQGETLPGEKTDASFLLDVTARVRVQKSGEVYVNVRNLLDEADLASRRPFGARPIAPRWVQVGTKWGF